MIEVGRHQKLPKTQRFCPLCPQLVEDEIHFLINCNQYAALRNPLLETCRELRQNFQFYNEKEKFVFMMTCNDTAFLLAEFLSKAMELRNEKIILQT